MQITYVVHSAVASPMQVTVDFNGTQMQATVDGFIVELVSQDGTMSHTLRFDPTKVTDAQALFQQGATIVATFAQQA